MGEASLSCPLYSPKQGLSALIGRVEKMRSRCFVQIMHRIILTLAVCKPIIGELSDYYMKFAGLYGLAPANRPQKTRP